ncbi:OLC1v1000775C1 [Oldenlandia corymbosa var. corymbosa]|uniref:OLC1v1000775C1 n=1 Tax=Oldenlandia corymbosa var. corymbosa TaxID=529605 RepID=A0AAV1D3N7_OLDCO|nr:OLC1v1000775C1 [Oldenlandia corymbosa var. corymbosa]
MGVTDEVLTEEHKIEIRRYFYNHQNADGGWGLHIEGHSVMFCTVLTYVSLRLLGESSADGDGAMRNARSWIIDRGGATFIPSWGKFWLSVLGVYEWDGNNPLLPELWLLPYILPIHPGHWNSARDQCAKEDLYFPHTRVHEILSSSLHNVVEPLLKKWPLSKLRDRALTMVMDHIHHEDTSTHYLCLGPLNKVLNMICCWVENPNSKAVKCHLARIKDYLWVAEDGMKMKGYNGTQLWDTAFSVQAIVASNLPNEYGRS